MNETNVLDLASNKPKAPDNQFANVDDTDIAGAKPGETPAINSGLSAGSSTTELPLGQGEYWNQPGPTGVVSSWESDASAQAGTQFQQNVLQGRQTLMRSRQEMEAQGQEAQTQLALGDYMRSQSAEKAGWTGGYMLDQKRQGDYLRASIEAQMYGQQELQRYGMETQLESARLAYDLGKQQLAMQLYNEAYQRAITEGQMFGYYVSPEIRDTLNQYNAAMLTLEDNPEDERALQLKQTVESWFQEQDIDPNDLSTFSRATFEREQYDQAKLDAVLASVGDDPSVFLLRDSRGNYSVDQDGQYIKMNFDTITKNDFLNFVNSDNNAEFAFADQTVKSYFKFLGQYTINDYLSGLGEDGVPSSEGFAAWLATGNNNRILKYLDELEITDPERKTLISNIGEEISATLVSRGVTLDLVTDLNQKSSSSVTNVTTGSTTGSSSYNDSWFESNEIENFESFVSVSQAEGKPGLNKVFYKDSDGTEKFVYAYGRTYIGDSETATNDLFISENDKFLYTFKFTDWADNKINNASSFNITGFAGLNKNFEIKYHTKDGNSKVLDFEFGNTLNAYYGFGGVAMSDSDLRYETINPTNGATNSIEYSNLQSSIEPGEFKFIRVSNNGNNPRRVLITKDPTGRFRLIEAAGGRGTSQHTALLTMMGYSKESFGDGIALG